MIILYKDRKLNFLGLGLKDLRSQRGLILISTLLLPVDKHFR